MNHDTEHYESPHLMADGREKRSLHDHIAASLAALSTPGSNIAAFFSDPDIAISGSGLNELFTGPEAAKEGVEWVAGLGLQWKLRSVVSWMRGDIAWAQVRIDVTTEEGGNEVEVPYMMTGVFARIPGGWRWLYWGGSEPQNPPRV